MNHSILTTLAVGMSMAAVGPLNAATTVTFPNVDLLADAANQAVPVYIRGADAVQAATFIAQMAGDGTRPKFQSADIIGGTIFAANNSGAPLYDLSADGFIVYADVATSSGSVVGGGLLTDAVLVTVLVDTTNVFGGSFTVSLVDTDWGDSSVARDGAAVGGVTFTGGTFTVVPEPAAMWMVGIAGYACLTRRAHP